MGHHREGRTTTSHKSHTLPSSPTHSFSSSSSSDFEFTISLSPRKSSTCNLCPADELFYKGQLLPLHLSPRISMVRTLLLSSSSTSSSSNSRHSSDSHSSFSTDAGCDSSRPSSVAEDEDLLSKRLNHTTTTKLFTSSSSSSATAATKTNHFNQTNNKKSPSSSSSKYFSLSRFSSVFRKECGKQKRTVDQEINIISGSTVKRMSVTAKEVIRRYLKKAKPLYEKLSHHQKHGQGQGQKAGMAAKPEAAGSRKDKDVISHSFSGNLRYYPRRRMGCASSCPSSMRSSPSHSGILCRNTVIRGTTTPPAARSYADSASMEELQSAIQGAIAHCKNSMVQSNAKAFDVRS